MISINKWFFLFLVMCGLSMVVFISLVSFNAGYECGWHDNDYTVRKVKGNIQQKSASDGWQIAGAGAEIPIRRLSQ